MAQTPQVNVLQSFEAIQDLARRALEEDAVRNDVTCEKTDLFMKLRGVDTDFNKSCIVVAKEEGIFSGRYWIEALAKVTGLDLAARLPEGASFAKGDVVCTGRGPWKKVIGVERTLLNELQMLCGVATRTAEFSTCLKKRWAKLLDEGLVNADAVAPRLYHTRKTVPLHRALQIQAVIAGGGHAHRTSLADRVLFKENHKYLLNEKKLSFGEFLKFLMGFDSTAMVEVETLEEAKLAVTAGVKSLMLDNFSPEKIGEALASLPAGLELEVSGGIRLETLESFVLPGVSRLSVGALTHGARSLDLSLDWV